MRQHASYSRQLINLSRFVLCTVEKCIPFHLRVDIYCYTCTPFPPASGHILLHMYTIPTCKWTYTPIAIYSPSLSTYEWIYFATHITIPSKMHKNVKSIVACKKCPIKLSCRQPLEAPTLISRSNSPILEDVVVVEKLVLANMAVGIDVVSDNEAVAWVAPLTTAGGVKRRTASTSSICCHCIVTM